MFLNIRKISIATDAFEIVEDHLIIHLRRDPHSHALTAADTFVLTISLCAICQGLPCETDSTLERVSVHFLGS